MHIENPTSGRRVRRAAAALVALAALVLALPAIAQAARVIEVDPVTDIDALGESVGVSGSGYVPADHPNGFYVAQAAVVDDNGTDVVRYGNAVLVHPNPTTATQLKLEDDGTFQGELRVTGGFTHVPQGGGAGFPINCAVVQCAVVSWQGRTNPVPIGATPGMFQSELYNSTDIDFSPAVAATPYSALDRGVAQTLDVTGAGFSTAGMGVYVAQTATIAGEVFTGDSRWIRPGGPTADVTLNPDGAFATEIEVASTFTDGEEVVDCTQVQCSISTWGAHTAPIPPGETPGVGQSAISASTDLHFEPAITVTPTTLPDTGKSALKVSGQIPPSLTAPGLYVSFGAWAYPFWADQDAFEGTTFVPVGQFDAQGEFEVTIEVSPAFTLENGSSVDCKAVQCGVFTMRAHSFSQTDRRLDSFNPVTFKTPDPKPGPDPSPPPPAPGAAAKSVVFKKAQKVSAKRLATVGRVVCASAGTCTVKAPKKIRIKIGKRKFINAKVIVPKRIAAGKRVPVKVKLTKAGAKALAKRGGKVGAKVKLVVSATGSKTTTVTFATKLYRAKARKK